MRSFLLLAGVVEALVSPRTATLGLGCFWEPSEKLLKLDGVVDTRCGYAGATFPDAKPDYNSVCGGDGNVECVPVWNLHLLDGVEVNLTHWLTSTQVRACYL